MPALLPSLLLHPGFRQRPVEHRLLQGALFVDRRTGGPASEEGAIDEAIRATEIRQGGLGDCHFLAAVGAVARRDPAKLRARFAAPGPEGCTVRFHRARLGGWLGPLRSVPLLRELGRPGPATEEVAVDFRLPVHLDTGQPAFAQPYVAPSGLRELWLLALVKAYARYHRAYLLAQVGLGANALGMLTGAPVRLREPSLFGEERLRDAVAGGEIVLATTIPDLLRGGRFALPASNPERLSPVHVYELLAAGPRTFTLRDPHGPERDVEVGFEDLCRYFLSFAICRP
jgi:hypothetical protein